MSNFAVKIAIIPRQRLKIYRFQVDVHKFKHSWLSSII